MLHLTKGAMFITNEYKQLHAAIDQAYTEKFISLNANKVLLAKETVASSLCDNKVKLLAQLDREKRELISNLDKIKETVDEQFDEVKVECESLSRPKRAKINLKVLRQNMLYVKEKLRNLIDHFSNLIECRLHFVKLADARYKGFLIDNPSLVGVFDQYPNRYACILFCTNS